jgi:CRP-like cAMP-binding protein/CheY-like chemotaxis protein
MKKILIIEDNNDMRENTAEILELANYKVFTAKNGKEGVELAQKVKPDLIICDIMMPVLDGYGVLHLLSKNNDTAAIPFIFLTAKAERTDLRKGMEMGADDYLTKPFDDIELLSAIESRLKKMDILKKEFPKNIEGLKEFISDAKALEDMKNITVDKELRKFKKKESIYSEGTYPKYVYLINTGKVKTFKTHELGKEFITGLYKEGDYIGYLALLDDSKYSDTAECLEDTEVYLIPKEEFYSLIFQNAAISGKFIKMLSGNLNEKEEQLVKLAYNSVRKRVAEALLSLENRYQKGGEEKFSMNISREDLANLSGTATESTIRTLSDFKDEGLIQISGSNITIMKHDDLVRMKS